MCRGLIEGRLTALGSAHAHSRATVGPGSWTPNPLEGRPKGDPKGKKKEDPAAEKAGSPRKGRSRESSSGRPPSPQDKKVQEKGKLGGLPTPPNSSGPKKVPPGGLPTPPVEQSGENVFENIEGYDGNFLHRKDPKDPYKRSILVHLNPCLDQYTVPTGDLRAAMFFVPHEGFRKSLEKRIADLESKRAPNANERSQLAWAKTQLRNSGSVVDGVSPEDFAKFLLKCEEEHKQEVASSDSGIFRVIYSLGQPEVRNQVQLRAAIIRSTKNLVVRDA